MMTIGTFEDLQIGQRVDKGFLTGVDGQKYRQPYVVIGLATHEEWRQQFIDQTGNPPPAWMDEEARKNGRFFKIHTD